MKKFIISAFLVLISIITFAAEKKENTLANVAVLNYINNTGSKDYDWLQGSLGDAVYESMKDVFEFNRINAERAESVAKMILKPGKQVETADIRYIAEKTKADIVIFGEYDYNKTENIIYIKTKIYHVSRNKITSELKNESPANNKLFQVTEKVAGDSVNHISVIAKEDIANMLDAAGKKKEADEKAKKTAVEGKKEKLALQSAESLKSGFSQVYFTTYAIGSLPLGVLFNGFAFGAGAGLTITNSMSSFIQFGGTFNFIDQFPAEKSTFSRWGMMMFNFQIFFGLNWIINNKVFIQPYLQAGLAMELTSNMEMIPTGGNPPYNRVDKTGFFTDPIITLGFRLPIRVGKDVFVTPFVEFSYIPYGNQYAAANRIFMGLLNFGVGASF